MSDTKFGRLANEVVSGGTQRPADPSASLGAAIGGGIAWTALLVYLAFVSPWMLVFVIGLAVSIMLHELGHFWTARRSGMKATQFFLGFGPRVWSIHRNGVEYGLRAIPLGGFVKIVGMTNLDEVAERTAALNGDGRIGVGAHLRRRVQRALGLAGGARGVDQHQIAGQMPVGVRARPGCERGRGSR